MVLEMKVHSRETLLKLSMIKYVKYIGYYGYG